MDIIAILMPGDMGHGIGRALREHGHDVVTCLAGRSDRTKGLAETAGLRDLPDISTVTREADLILSILPPSQAVPQAEAVSRAMGESGSTPVYVDCNAISPATSKRAGEAIAGAGASYIDAGIIGLAPGKAGRTRVHVSGPDTTPMEALDGKGFEVIAMGGEIGRASGLKMCYAGLTKGTWTLQTAILLAGEMLEVGPQLRDEFQISQQAALTAMRERIPRLPADSGRWIGEMEEIAATFADVDVPSGFHEGAAEIFRILAQTPFASETRETMDASRTLEDALAVYTDELKKRS